jgi:TonB family protein
MHTAPPQSKPWLHPKWCALVASVFAIQMGLVLWLGARQAPQPQPARSGPALRLAGEGAAELLKLTDPTLFALPHREGFSGPAWLSVPSQEILPFAWTEPPRFLLLPANQLAAGLAPFPVADNADRWPPPANLQAELLLSKLDESKLFPANSTFRLSGVLENRRLKAPPELPSWPSLEVLSNSVVQVQVDDEGVPFSVTLLERSGSKEADDLALREARAVRFQPLESPGAARSPATLAWSELVFEWHTLPATNSSSTKP